MKARRRMTSSVIAFSVSCTRNMVCPAVSRSVSALHDRTVFHANELCVMRLAEDHTYLVSGAGLLVRLPGLQHLRLQATQHDQPGCESL